MFMNHRLYRGKLLTALLACLLLPIADLGAREVAGVTVEERITTSNGDSLLLNGAGLREKLWVDVYVGSLYLPTISRDIAEIYSNQGAYRIQMDFVYKVVSRDNLIEAWQEGFENNQKAETLQTLQADLERLYAMFEGDAVKGDQFIFDYSPGKGVSIIINGTQVGQIEGRVFKDALLDIWLGNKPADKDLKRAMVGLE